MVRSKLFATTLISVAALLASATSARANSIPTTGSRISLFHGPAQYPAATPFYVEQGFICPLAEGVDSCMNSDFVLTVDGQQQQSVTDIDTVVRDGTTYLQRDELTNFPIGLNVGTHTLTGYWYQGGVLTSTQTLVVTFS
jgi:hypothetical protein